LDEFSMTGVSNNRSAGSVLPPTSGVHNEDKDKPSTKGKSLLVTFHEGYSTYTIVVPMPYAVKFFVDGLTSALGLLTQKNEFLPFPFLPFLINLN
jgi:hypothetical protein